MNLRISIADTASPKLRFWLKATTGPNSRRKLHAAIGVEIQALTFDYLTDLAATRHDTANRLGAAPSGFLAQAADKVAPHSNCVTSTSNGATLTINHPGMIRALRDVRIVPREAKSLAIPVDSIAYNRRPRQLWEALHLFIPKGKNEIAMAAGKNQIRVLYILVRAITQKQDRTLLPSDDAYRAAALQGARNYYTMIKQQASAAVS